MPISPAIFVEIKATATRYRMMVWKFGGDEPTLKDAGFGAYDYIAGIILGPNSALLVDRTCGFGDYAVERAGFFRSADLAAAWEWLLHNFDVERGNILISVNQNKEQEWKVTSVEKLGQEVKQV